MSRGITSEVVRVASACLEGGVAVWGSAVAVEGVDVLTCGSYSGIGNVAVCFGFAMVVEGVSVRG